MSKFNIEFNGAPIEGNLVTKYETPLPFKYQIKVY